MSNFPEPAFPLIGKISPVSPNNKVYIISYFKSSAFWVYYRIKDDKPVLYVSSKSPMINTDNIPVDPSHTSNPLALFDYNIGTDINIASFTITIDEVLYYIQSAGGNTKSTNSALKTDFLNYYTELPGLYAGFVQMFWNYVDTAGNGAIIIMKDVDGTELFERGIISTLFIPTILFNKVGGQCTQIDPPDSYGMIGNSIDIWVAGLAGSIGYATSVESCNNVQNLVYCYNPKATSITSYLLCGSDIVPTTGCFGRCPGDPSGSLNDGTVDNFCTYFDNIYQCIGGEGNPENGDGDDDKPFWQKLWFIILISGFILIGGGILVAILYIMAHKKEHP